MSLILANKYRPRKLSDLIGQPAVVATLTNAIKNKNIHHAYLLQGNFGCGKSTSARILAAMVNCENGPTTDPCGKCDHCVKIFENRHPDVIALDAASGGKIDEVRTMKSNAYHRPISGCKKKIFIIEECHSLTTQGEEALLLLIEEPPEHVMFIMTTTELAQMRNTILSRCQVHKFSKVYWTVLFDHLKKIANAENLKIDDDSLRLCTKLANGSVRNALQYLDKLLAYSNSGDGITLGVAQDVLGVSDYEVYSRLVNCIIGDNGKPSTAEGYKIINDLICSGVDCNTILSEVEEYMRCLLVLLTNKSKIEFPQYSDATNKMMLEQKNRFSIQNVLKIMGIFPNAHKSLEYGISAESILDQLLIKSIIFCHSR